MASPLRSEAENRWQIWSQCSQQTTTAADFNYGEIAFASFLTWIHPQVWVITRIWLRKIFTTLRKEGRKEGTRIAVVKRENPRAKVRTYLPYLLLLLLLWIRSQRSNSSSPGNPRTSGTDSPPESDGTKGTRSEIGTRYRCRPRESRGRTAAAPGFHHRQRTPRGRSRNLRIDRQTQQWRCAWEEIWGSSSWDLCLRQEAEEDEWKRCRRHRRWGDGARRSGPPQRDRERRLRRRVGLRGLWRSRSRISRAPPSRKSPRSCHRRGTWRDAWGAAR